MNNDPDQPDRHASEDESPEIAEVRRLLADARHTEPMPDDVALRLDRVIARLGDEDPAATPATSDGGTVLPIAAHRRRRAAALLVAAAAIVVGGVAAGQLVHPGSSGGGASTANAPEAQTYDNGSSEDQPLSSGEKSDPGKTEIRRGRVVVRPQYFAFDALRGRQLLKATRATAPSDHLDRLEGCGIRAKRARAVPAEYEKAPAALLYRRPEGGHQIVDLVVCGSAQPIKTATLPAP